MKNLQNVKDLLLQFTNDLTAEDCGVLSSDDLRGKLGSCEKLLASTESNKQSELLSFQVELERRLKVEGRVLFYQALVCHLYLQNIGSIASQGFPDGVRDFVCEDFSRSVKLALEGRENFLNIENYIFFSYLEVLCFQRFPLGNHSAVVSGFSRSLIFKQFPRKLFEFLMIHMSCGGNSPFLELHYNPHRMRLFNPEGWESVMRFGAELLRCRPEYKGIFGTSWLFDPCLAEVSPELSYLRKQIASVGGKLFFAGHSERDRRNAFAMSKKRRVAYEKGLYSPAGYLAIMPRKTLLEFFGM